MAAIRVNKIASVVYRLGLGLDIDVTENLEARSGNVVVARIRSDKRVYNELELVGGRMAKIGRGDVIVGALGRRRALQGFVGDVPETIQKGDEIHLLNMGGVVGVARSALRELGDPARLEVLGMAVKGQQILNVADGALESVGSLKDTDEHDAHAAATAATTHRQRNDGQRRLAMAITEPNTTQTTRSSTISCGVTA